MAEARLRAGAWRKAQRRRACARGVAADARRSLWPVVPGDEELLRAEGLQLFRSLCAVRRTSRGSHRGRPAVRTTMAGDRAASLSGARAHAAGAHAPRPLWRQNRWQGRDADARGARRVPEGQWLEARLLALAGRAGSHEMKNPATLP